MLLYWDKILDNFPYLEFLSRFDHNSQNNIGETQLSNDVSPLPSENTLPTATPAPLEAFSLPDLLNGSQGTNRAPDVTTKQITANNDLAAIRTWLAEFDDSPQTYRTYRKEAERLLLWSILCQKKPLSSLSHDDLRDYYVFLSDPTPSAVWCGPRKPRNHPDWKPFEGKLKAKSIAQALTILNVLFSYLVEAGYLRGNPLGLMRRHLKRRSQSANTPIDRYLEPDCWKAVLQFIEALPQTTRRDKIHYERVRYLFYLLYLLGSRVSEVANARMSDIFQIRGQWWWTVTGKGQKTSRIPVNDCLLEALARYRQFYGLPPFPAPNEDCGLFMRLNGGGRVSANLIYRLVKQTFQDCAATLETTHPLFSAKLRQASTHWLRHTAITHQTDAGIDLRYVKLNARHESVETTMRYQHAEESRWHEAMAGHRINRESS